MAGEAYDVINEKRIDVNHWAYDEFKNLGINCGRTIKRFIRTMITLSQNIGESIAAASDDKAEAKAMYRLFENKKVTEEVVLHAHRTATIQKMKESGESIILSVQDTTMLNYATHKKTKGLGDFGAGSDDKGLIVHSALAVTPKGIALGLLDQHIWTRDPDERGKRTEKRQKPIEEKESYKWLRSMDQSQTGVSKDIRLVHVGDREADVYEFFDHAITNQQDVLVRIVQNRITSEACKLFDQIKQEPPAGQIVAHIPRDTRRNLPAREATLEIRYSRLNIQAPRNTPKKFIGNRTLTLSFIHVQEVKPPEGMEPIEWYLATSLDVASLDEAAEKITWYIHRWKIERFHYILKSGCEIEKLQNRTAERLQKLILVYSIISARILGMTYMARQYSEEPCTMFFEEEEWKVLYCIANRIPTAPDTAPTIKEAVSYLAKLGGFLGRKGDGEPGAKVIWKGLNELNIVLKYRNYLSP